MQFGFGVGEGAHARSADYYYCLNDEAFAKIGGEPVSPLSSSLSCPDLGEAPWDRLMAALYATGYDFVVSIEHEDRQLEGSEDLVKRGFYLSRNVLAPLMV